MCWIFLVAAVLVAAVVAVIVWVLYQHGAGSKSVQAPASLMSNQGQTAPLSPVQPPPPRATRASMPDVQNVPRAAPSAQPAQARAPRLRSPAARWIPPGETAEVAGHSLPGGMLYVGSGLPAIKEWTGLTEPALLDPTLVVDKRQVDFEGRLMTYWPSYSTIQPASRAAYLRWLAGGRSEPGVGIGYVFLFFYGLERRLLFDRSRSEISREESDAILAEVQRLIGIYASSNSFRRYASTFHGLGLVLRGSVDVEALEPPLRRDGWDLPIATRLALGAFASEGKPLPAEWALSWVLTAPDTVLRTPAQRCPDEFRELFLLRYRESFGDGIKLRGNKTNLAINYQPASASFGGMVTLTTSLPDLTQSMSIGRLRQLMDQCTQDLDPYSRWVGRTGETSSPPAVALLPAPLARGRGDEKTRALGEWLEARLDGRDLSLIESSEMLNRWPCKEEGRPSRRELETLSDFLASRGLGIEPDAALGGTALNRAQRAALFRLPGGQRDTPSSAFQGAAVLMNLAAMVAAADGEVTAGEERHLMEHLETSLDLPAADRARLEAHFRWLASDPPTFSRAKKSLEQVPQHERRTLGPLLISLAGADGHLAPKEMKVLSKMYPLLGLEIQALYSDVHQLMSAQRAPAAEPVPVRPAELPQGFAVPRSGQDGKAAPLVELDLDKVRAKLAETERVSSLLGQIFVDEEEAAPAPPPVPSPAADDYTVAGLDGAHSALLLRLAGSATWERAQIERLADAIGLLPDGALEVINEAAFAACGAPLLEGDEIIEIDQEVLQEMLP